ncbi:MAG: DUF2249 domain-containing protein [Firmicutes bacterium]|jgi:uncharacterized protein (DUF2249 family)|nr:DUF2249 domain-containing protein [Bacillota bacterium]
MKQLDVRPTLLAGGEPFMDIMTFVNTLEPGEGFELLATFRPDPLLKVMETKGFSNVSAELGDGSWLVTFTPAD